MIGGFIACLVSLPFEAALKSLMPEGGSLGIIFNAFVTFALVEELAKALAAISCEYRCPARDRRDFARRCILIAIGFSIVENSFYANSFLERFSRDQSAMLLVVRLLMPTVLHVLCGLLYTLDYNNRRFELRWGFVSAIALHGIYDVATGFAQLKLTALLLLFSFTGVGIVVRRSAT